VRVDAQPLELGRIGALKQRLPLIVEYQGRRWRLLEVAGEILVHACACPHNLLPMA